MILIQLTEIIILLMLKMQVQFAIFRTTYIFTPTGAPTFAYDWTLNPTFLSATNTANPIATAVTSSQSYSVTVTGNSGCKATTTTTVTVASGAPTVSVTPAGPISLCGGTQLLTANPIGAGPFNYAWTLDGNPVGGDTATLTASATGAYAVTVTDACMLSSTVSNTVAITVNSLPTIVTVSGAGTFCSTASITASNGSDGTMYFQGTTSGGTATATASSSESITTSGTYYSDQSAAGCWGPEGSAIVVIESPVTLTTTPASICAGTSGTLQPLELVLHMLQIILLVWLMFQLQVLVHVQLGELHIQQVL